MKIRAAVDAVDRLFASAGAAARELTAVVDDFDAGWGERWLPR